ncbi:fumarylacetoacetate hydrolase family protein [Luteococcus sp. Sow4_B9]|uniref:fumarylacetoacetate hydrolase family protein n=1 Tax=Luteococcus sp. Sow4_B9 TaxID=3438792 RepID=UPI003F987B7C
MRIARYALAGAEPQFGLVELAADGGEHPDTVAAITGDPLAGPVNYTGERHSLEDVRLLAPVIPRSKVVGVGRNYVAHAQEMGNSVPETPLVFFKPNTAVIGPDEPIVRPSATKDLHHEGELAVVIGRICKQVPIERVQEVIFGYTIANDITARDLQASDGQWARAKGWDTFCPLGPWVVTHLTLEEAGDLQITTTVADQRTPDDEEVRQDDSTRLMVRSIAELVSHISEFTTLLPGDVILTGTPAGVGPVQPGQRVRVAIEEIGELCNPVVDEE